ncbi:MAG TPA: hypothetical protein ENI23_07325 [bacterium]|nr:hypothetical protein [bacterium]
MTGTVGLILLLIGMLIGIGIALWIFTHDVGQCKVDTKTCSRYTGELPPDEILERHVMHKEKY